MKVNYISNYDNFTLKNSLQLLLYRERLMEGVLKQNDRSTTGSIFS